MGDLVLVQGLPTTAALLARVAGNIDNTTVHTASASQVIADVEAGQFTGDVIVLGMNVDSPMRVAQRIHSLDVEIPIVVMCLPEHHERLSRAFRLSPFLGFHVYCRAFGNSEGLGSALMSAVTVGRERRRRLAERRAESELTGVVATRFASEPARYLDRLLDSAPIGVLVLDAGGHLLAWNERAFRIFALSEREVIGTPLVDLFANPARAHVARAMSEAVTVTVERTRADGHEQTLEVSVASVPGHWGEPCAMVLVQDVTERATAERLARAHQEEQLKFVALAENAVDLVAMGTLDGEVFYLNPAGRRMVGLSEAEAKRKKVLQYFAKPFRARLQSEVLPTVLSTGSWSGEGQVRHIRSGRAVDVLVNVFLVRHPASGEPLCIATVMRDISERKCAEDALHHAMDELEVRVRERTAELRAAEKEARDTARFLDSIVENLPNMVFVKDAEALRFVRFNRAGEDLLGYSRADLLGKNDYDFFPKEEADFFTSKDRQVLNGGRMVDIPEEPIHTRTRGIRYLHTKKIPVVDGAGRPLFLLGISDDITERKELAEARARQAEELARSNAELERFAHVASHDLQEPLRKIQAFGTMLASRHGEALDPRGRDLLERMQSAAGRMQALIDDVLLFSRVTAPVRSFVPVDLAAVAHDVLADLDVRVRETSATVDVGPLPTIEADPMQMHQLLQNLIGNAIKFHRDGVSPEVTVRASVSGGACELTVADRGIGFDEKHEGRIFVPFQRLHGRGKYEGTGMGLAICRRIVERHRGSIAGRSEPGVGATFVVVLPLTHDEGGGDM